MTKISMSQNNDGGLLTVQVNAHESTSGRDRLHLERDCSIGAKENNRKEGDQSRPK